MYRGTLCCLWQDYKDLELDIIPASLTHTDPEVNLNDPNHEVNEEKKKSARKKEWGSQKCESIKCIRSVFFPFLFRSTSRQCVLSVQLITFSCQLVPGGKSFSDQYFNVQSAFRGAQWNCVSAAAGISWQSCCRLSERTSEICRSVSRCALVLRHFYRPSKMLNYKCGVFNCMDFISR